LRPGAKNIVAPPLTKAAEFEVKNRRKSAEETKAKHLLLLLLFYSISKLIKRV